MIKSGSKVNLISLSDSKLAMSVACNRLAGMAMSFTVFRLLRERQNLTLLSNNARRLQRKA